MTTSPTSVSIVQVDSQQARDFFLKSSTYCRLELPSYFDFQALINEVNKSYMDKVSKGIDIKEFFDFRTARKSFNVNYSIFANKDSSFNWRKLQIIYPLFYVHLVHILTEPNNWAKIQDRFKDFSANKKIESYGLPVISDSSASDTEEQIINWYQNIEQNSIKLSMEFDYLFDTDIADCYGSIYTHSLAWAIETKT